jgi:hypothetical protein
MNLISTLLDLNMAFKSILIISKMMVCTYGNLHEVQVLNNVKLNLDL